MRREVDTLVDDLQLDATDGLDPAALRDPAMGTLRTSASVNSAAQTDASTHNRTFTDRIKALFSNLDKALEGDHDFHNYLGM